MKRLLGGPGDAHFAELFGRVLNDSNWSGAAAAAAARGPAEKPWIVFVTWLNGIRFHRRRCRTETICQLN